MEALLLVELVPTGEVVNVTVLESSGDAAFDRSAEAAVRKARRFEVPKEPDMFEEHFRQFTLLFRPEDLLR
jgi:colicin import membrane protein